MSYLDEVFKACYGSEDKFKYRSVLFIGSESYDAPTITIIEGLNELGFDIYTLRKPNINSWFCNRVVESVSNLKFDFVLSNLHWGTRWSDYERFDLGRYPKVLIDGDDNHYRETWKDKFARYRTNYTYNPPKRIKDMIQQPYRWIEPLGSYVPDIIFTSQKMPGDDTTFYLPFGIHRQYLQLSHNNTPTKDRDIDFTHIPGTGERRETTERWVRWLSRAGLIPGEVYNRPARGKEVAPQRIETLVRHDSNVHSYHRWTVSQVYSDVLSRTKVLIYPGVRNTSQWDSKRPWEGFANGCLVLFARPTAKVNSYPPTEISSYAVYESFFELVYKCQFLHRRQSFLDRLRREAVERALKFFTSKPIARYFLEEVASELNIDEDTAPRFRGDVIQASSRSQIGKTAAGFRERSVN